MDNIYDFFASQNAVTIVFGHCALAPKSDNMPAIGRICGEELNRRAVQPDYIDYLENIEQGLFGMIVCGHAEIVIQQLEAISSYLNEQNPDSYREPCEETEFLLGMCLQAIPKLTRPYAGG